MRPKRQRKRIILKILSIVLFLSSIVSVQAKVWSFQAKVVRVVDGDTIEVLRRGNIQRVRIWGIDTPEWDQPYSAKSKAFTQHQLSGKEVEVIPKEYDKYGRLVAQITANHNNFSEELVRLGLAWVHIYYCNEPVCDRWRVLQNKARKEHRGLWHSQNPIAPWRWKKNHPR